MNFVEKIFRGDRVIWMIFMFLCLISIVEVYSASSTLTFRTDYWKPIMRHSMFLLVGVGIVLLVHGLKPKYFSILGVILPFVWGLLIITLAFGERINDATRWLTIGGQSIQPSEIAKLSLMVLIAFILSKKNDWGSEKSFKWIVIASAITCAIILRDNFSTAILLLGVVILLMFIGQIPIKKLLQLVLVLLCIGALFVAFIYFTPNEPLSKVLSRGPTWKTRIKDFNADKNTKLEDFDINENYQVGHANIAIANGKVLGKMPGNSRERDFLPQAYSDFIYAIIIEEMGLIGGIAVLLLYIILFIRAGIIAQRSEKLFPKLLVMGAALILFSQALANMSVAVGLIPVTGQPLPLISRGGTSTLINCIYIGMILSVSRFENPKGIHRDEEIIEELEEAEKADEEAPFIEIEFDLEKEREPEEEEIII